MIEQEFNIHQMGLNYFIGITEVKIDIDEILEDYNIPNNEDALQFIFKIVDELQNKHNELIIQAFRKDYILNQDHIFIACYYLKKALFNDTLISNKKNIELLLYLSTYRQIGKAIKSFGLDLGDLKYNTFIICIISPMNNLQEIINEILKTLRGKEIKISINELTPNKIIEIIKFYDLSEPQIKSVLNSYGIKEFNLERLQNNLQNISLVVFDLICEKMALLNLEKI